jgi:hypothetical protein
MVWTRSVPLPATAAKCGWVKAFIGICLVLPSALFCTFSFRSFLACLCRAWRKGCFAGYSIVYFALLCHAMQAAIGHVVDAGGLAATDGYEYLGQGDYCMELDRKKAAVFEVFLTGKWPF